MVSFLSANQHQHTPCTNDTRSSLRVWRRSMSIEPAFVTGELASPQEQGLACAVSAEMCDIGLHSHVQSHRRRCCTKAALGDTDGQDKRSQPPREVPTGEGWYSLLSA